MSYSSDWLADDPVTPQKGGWRGVATTLLWTAGAVAVFGVTLSWAYGLGARDPSAVPAFAAAADAGGWRSAPDDAGGLILPDQGLSVFERFGLADGPDDALEGDAPADAPTEFDEASAATPGPEDFIAMIEVAVQNQDQAVRERIIDLTPPAPTGGDGELFTVLDTDVPQNFGTDTEPTLADAPEVTLSDEARAGLADPLEEADAAEPPEADAPAVADLMMDEMEAAEEVEPQPTIPAEALAVYRPEADGLFQVQLAAVESEAIARDYWSDAQSSHAEILGDHSLAVEQVSHNEGRLWRVRFGAFETRAEASAVCRALQARGQDCFVGAR